MCEAFAGNSFVHMLPITTTWRTSNSHAELDVLSERNVFNSHEVENVRLVLQLIFFGIRDPLQGLSYLCMRSGVNATLSGVPLFHRMGMLVSLGMILNVAGTS